MKNKKTIIKVLHYIKNYKYYVILSLFTAGINVASSLYIPILTGYAIDCIIDFKNVDYTRLLDIIQRIIVVMIVTGISQWIMNTCNNKITFHVVKDIRNQAFNNIQRLPLSYIDKNSYGDIVSRVIADTDQFADGLLMGFTQLFTGILTIVGTIGFMLSINIKITTVVVLITPLSLFVAAFIAKKTYNMFKLQSQTRGEQTSLIEEMIGHQKVVTAFGYQDKAIQRFDYLNENLKKYSLNATFFSSLTNPCTRFVNSMVYAGVCVTGAYFAIRGNLTVGQLSCFLSYANQYTKPFNEISGVITEIQNAIACADRIFELIEEPCEKEDLDNLQNLDNVMGDIKIENVSFSYNKNKPLINAFNLNVKRGLNVAIVGPTGCGKTTLINLLMRFYDVNSGTICIDNIPINDVTKSSLRKNFGMVLQETWLKSGTIKDNIIMGKPDATDEEIINAAKLSHAHSFIKRLPNGYDTIISEGKDSLSQGQKQLLCITRIMLTLPPMLILDEATSSIDTRTELQIQNAFSTMMEGRTSFIVAHRLSTIREADIILVMKDGNIIEQGNHKTLLAQNGFYANLYKAATMN